MALLETSLDARLDLLATLERFETTTEREAARRLLLLTYTRPGPSFREVLRHLPTGEGRSRCILRQLVHDGALVQGDALGASRVYPPTMDDGTAQHQVAVLRDEDVARLFSLLLGGTWCQADLFRKAEAWGWKWERSRRCLEKLHLAGLVRRIGGSARYLLWEGVAPHPQTGFICDRSRPTVDIGPIKTLCTDKQPR